MSSPSTDESQLTEAARLTVAFTLLYSLTIINITATKARLYREARQKETTFDRYKSPQMLIADRLQGNFLEWSPIFLGLVWSLAAIRQLTLLCVGAAWGYLALRVLYLVLIMKYGVHSSGRNVKLWPSTMPSYLCLLFMGQHAIRSLLFKF